MAPGTRAKRQRDIASTLQPSVETAADSAPPLSDIKKPSDDRESSNTGHEADKTEGSQRQRLWTPVPQTYDPETYDPEGRMPWTPEPEPYDPETYAAWGRKHFGDDWYEQRKIMLQERNIYARDKVYGSRQKALRVMEHKIEGRPFEPREGLLNEGWQRLWARLSKVLPSVEHGSNPASPSPDDNDSNSNDGSEQSNVTGYSTYPPTPEPRVFTPEPDDPWERLELNRRRMHWDEERYQFGRIFLKEGLIDKARNQRENEEGNRKKREEWDAILELKGKNNLEYECLKRHYNLRTKGWTQEQIDAADRADTAAWEWEQKNPPPRRPILFSPPITQEERDAYDAWLQKERAARLRIYGELPPSGSGPLGQPTTQEKDAYDTWRDAYDTWRRNIHARVSSQHEQEPGASATADASATEKGSRLRSPTPRAKNTSHKIRGGRITKSTAQIQSVANRGTRSRRAMPTPSEAPMPNSRSTQLRRAPDEPDDSPAQAPRMIRKRQPKVYKERASDAVGDIDGQVLQSKPHNTRQRSRRLAGHLPEYGILPKRGEPAPPYNPQLRHPSNTRKSNPSGPHGRALSKKKSIATKSAKPQGISKSGREETNRSKRSKKQSGG